MFVYQVVEQSLLHEVYNQNVSCSFHNHRCPLWWKICTCDDCFQKSSWKSLWLILRTSTVTTNSMNSCSLWVLCLWRANSVPVHDFLQCLSERIYHRAATVMMFLLNPTTTLRIMSALPGASLIVRYVNSQSIFTLGLLKTTILFNIQFCKYLICNVTKFMLQ